MRQPLPVDAAVPGIIAALSSHSCVVVEAPPGAGKTTRVPPALLSLGQVLVLEPRRIAARMAARRVALEMGETPGQTVGYQVRFEEVAGPDTRLRFLTEGVLTRRLLGDRDLRGIACVVLDEFHERHLEGDLALALLRHLQKRRGGLRIVVMSATLDGQAVSAYLDGCPVVKSEGRLFPVEIRYTPHSSAPLEEQVRDAVERLLAEELEGHVLIFLPGAAEIRRAMRACEGVARRAGCLALPLHGDLPPEEQDRAVLPSDTPKLIFSTNVAESSVTIDGVTCVIDSGLARVARDSPWSGLATLEVTRISKASANQRAGRAGRTAAGRVIRLYPLEDFVRRPDADVAEIARRELSSVLLALDALGLAPDEVPWYEPPPRAAIDAAWRLLDRLGARRNAKRLARFPVHPRLAVLLTEGGPEAARVAAALSLGERAPSADVLALASDGGSAPSRRLASQLERLARGVRTPAGGIEIALLKAFPDRVVPAHTVKIPPDAHALAESGLLLAIDIEQRREFSLPLLRLGLRVEPEWLVETFPETITERHTVEWNRAAERVEAASALLYDGVVIEESRTGTVDAGAAAKLLAAKAIEAGVQRFTDPEKLEAVMARCQFASRFSTLPSPAIEAALETACEGRRSFAELVRVDLAAAVLAQLSPGQRKELDTLAPEHVTLASGRRARIHYSRDKDPWVASRLQDFFGLRETPRIGGGRVPLVVHLLAPNQRPVQTTTDLAGFWERLYPQVRRELSRRYPKHSWPERV